MEFIGIIPARYASTRFPGKPLANILGKSMIMRVYEQCKQSSSLSKVIVATDDIRIKEHLEENRAEVIMTSGFHKTGTDRCNEAIKLIDKEDRFDVIINIQGDEPFINPSQIDLLTSCFSKPQVQIATLIKKISNTDELLNPNVVKVITDNQGRAIYFSRSVIPFCRDIPQEDWLKKQDYYKHIGIYAYRKKTLNDVTILQQSSLEKAESLEQLRWIENSYFIQTSITEFESFGIDSPDDIQMVEKKNQRIK